MGHVSLGNEVYFWRVLNIKGAYDRYTGPAGSPEAIRASVEQALKGLGGAKAIDIFEMGMRTLKAHEIVS